MLAGILVYVESQERIEGDQWLTLKTSRGDLDVVVTATGSLAPDTTVQVGTQVSGKITKLYVDWNSRVNVGETMARLDTTFLWASVEQAEANLKKATVEEAEAKTNLERVTQLYARNLDSRAVYDTTLASYQSAQSDVNSARTAFDETEINLGYATIKAPISGVVLSRNVDIGETVAASYSTPTLFSIANSLTDLQILAYVDEGDIGSVKVKQHVTFNVDAYPNDVFKGTVTQVRLQPDTVQNVVEYVVVIDAPNPDLKLLPGMTANLTIHVAEDRNVIKVPTTALRFVPPAKYMAELSGVVPDSVVQRLKRESLSQSAAGVAGQEGQEGYANRQLNPGSFFVVWVPDGKGMKPVRVRIGLSDGVSTEVEGNLKDGEPVIVGMLVGDH